MAGRCSAWYGKGPMIGVGRAGVDRRGLGILMMRRNKRWIV